VRANFRSVIGSLGCRGNVCGGEQLRHPRLPRSEDDHDATYRVQEGDGTAGDFSGGARARDDQGQGFDGCETPVDGEMRGKTSSCDRPQNGGTPLRRPVARLRLARSSTLPLPDRHPFPES